MADRLYAPNLAGRLRKYGFSVHQDPYSSALRVRAAVKSVEITVDFPEALQQLVVDDVVSQLKSWGYAVETKTPFAKGGPVLVVKVAK